MPTYVYGPKGESKEGRCEVCSATFEIVQRMSDDPLQRCPKCGKDVERQITAPNLSGVGPIQKPSDSRMSKAGFTQYKRVGKGCYEKSFGQGPPTLQG
jgi:putative FmdB family regulatory protein